MKPYQDAYGQELLAQFNSQTATAEFIEEMTTIFGVSPTESSARQNGRANKNASQIRKMGRRMV